MDAAENMPWVDLALVQYPGQRFTADEQCKLMYGPASYYCAVSNFTFHLKYGIRTAKQIVG